MEYDGGSPLPEGSPMAGPSSPQVTIDRLFPQKIKQQLGKRIVKRRRKKLGRPYKIVVSTAPDGTPLSSEATAPLPTSVLLVAGTSSRGRKIVRKEDTNFVTS